MTSSTPASEPVRNPSCDAECGALIRAHFAEWGVDAVVTAVAPLVASPYDDLNMTCPHGVTWHTEPTGDQRATWAREGVL